VFDSGQRVKRDADFVPVCPSHQKRSCISASRPADKLLRPNTTPTQRHAVPRAEHQRRIKIQHSFREARGIGSAALKGYQQSGSVAQRHPRLRIHRENKCQGTASAVPQKRRKKFPSLRRRPARSAAERGKEPLFHRHQRQSRLSPRILPEINARRAVF
jgi:hypothetical protein